MNDYEALYVKATPFSEDISDLISAFLCDIGYESFTTEGNTVTAYIPQSAFSLESAREVLADFPIPVELEISHEFIEGKDWNEEWEKNYFKPIVVGGECVVHSSFHHDVPEGKYDILIDPKMAFGTGHHSTTSLMLRYILDSDLDGKDVIDMGTGTGILAILCKMKGAERVTGIEIDEAAYVNAIENCRLNNVEINLIHGDASRLVDVDYNADYFLANINRNVITSDIENYAAKLKTGGKMFLSGFYEEDVPIVEEAAVRCDLALEKVAADNKWCALCFVKK